MILQSPPPWGCQTNNQHTQHFIIFVVFIRVVVFLDCCFSCIVSVAVNVVSSNILLTIMLHTYGDRIDYIRSSNGLISEQHREAHRGDLTYILA